MQLTIDQFTRCTAFTFCFKTQKKMIKIMKKKAKRIKNDAWSFRPKIFAHAWRISNERMRTKEAGKRKRKGWTASDICRSLYLSLSLSFSLSLTHSPCLTFAYADELLVPFFLRFFVFRFVFFSSRFFFVWPSTKGLCRIYVGSADVQQKKNQAAFN